MAPDRRDKVLVIDDSEITRGIIEQELSSAGLRVTTMENPLGAILQISRDEIDVVLLDINMPVISGPRFAKLLRSNPRLDHVRLILMTGDDGFDLDALGVTVAADGILPKRALEQDLVPTVLSSLRLKRTQAVRPRAPTVAVVESDNARITWLTKRLESLGCTIKSHGQGEGAAAMIAAAKPIAVLISASLPDMPGDVLANFVLRQCHRQGVGIIRYDKLDEREMSKIAFEISNLIESSGIGTSTLS